MSSEPARVCLPPPRRAGGIILPPEFFRLELQPLRQSQQRSDYLKIIWPDKPCAGCVKSDSARRHRSAPSSLRVAINIKRHSIFFFYEPFRKSWVGNSGQSGIRKVAPPAITCSFNLNMGNVSVLAIFYFGMITDYRSKGDR